MSVFFFLNETTTTEIYPLSQHAALPICPPAPPGGPAPRRDRRGVRRLERGRPRLLPHRDHRRGAAARRRRHRPRSEEHTSELQSRQYLVCRLLLEKKKN